MFVWSSGPVNAAMISSTLMDRKKVKDFVRHMYKYQL